MMRQAKAFWLVAGLVLSQGASTIWAAPQAVDFYVSTQGRDGWSGKLSSPNEDETDGPFATIGRAQEAVKELRDSPEQSGSTVVAIRGGRYFLESPIVFGPEDSGDEASPVIYRAYQDERPIFSGGRLIEDWERGPNGHWQTTLPEVASGEWAFSQLFVDGQRRFRPRVPEDGYHRIAKEMQPSEESQGKGYDRFGFAEGDLSAEWDNLSDVEIVAFHIWSASRMRIDALDAAEKTVTFTGRTSSTSWWGAFPNGHRYLAINVKEALNDPGEWYLDGSTGELTYIPREGEKPGAVTVIAPKHPELLKLTGDVKERDWVKHLTFEGLTFAHANWTIPSEGHSFPQAEVDLRGAIQVVGGRNVRFEDCVVRNVGQYGMAFGPGSRDNRVEGCELVDLGAGGIKIGLGGGSGSWPIQDYDADAPEAKVRNHTVHDTLIAHGGRLHPAAVGIWLGHTSHNQILHNHIHDFYYTGLSIGWTWGYHTPSRTHHNDIGYNHVHDLGQRVLSDLGGIYTLGVSPGTRIHHNRFHDIQSYDYGGWGLYTDEGSSYIVMENNLVYRTRTGGFHQHYGRENQIRNNIFVNGGEWQIQRTRTEDHLSFTFKHNIVYWSDDSPLFGSNWKDDHYVVDSNLYWNGSERSITFPNGLSLEEWRERGHDRDSVIADPRFVDAEDGDFRLKANSPAHEIGFRLFDDTKAGRAIKEAITEDLPSVPRGFDSVESE